MQAASSGAVSISGKARLIARIGATIVRLLVKTLRFRITDQAGILGTNHPRAIWLFWHNRMLVIPHLLNRYLPERKGSALTSASKDGEIVAAFLDCFRILPVRGSSSRRGVVAMREMVRLISDGIGVENNVNVE